MNLLLEELVVLQACLGLFSGDFSLLSVSEVLAELFSLLHSMLNFIFFAWNTQLFPGGVVGKMTNILRKLGKI